MRCDRKGECLIRSVLELCERLVHDGVANHLALHGIEDRVPPS